MRAVGLNGGRKSLQLFTVCPHTVRARGHIPSSERQKPPPQGSPGNTAPPPARESPQGRPRPLSRPLRIFVSPFRECPLGRPLPREPIGQPRSTPATHPLSIPHLPRLGVFLTLPAGQQGCLRVWGPGRMWGRRRRRRRGTGAEVGAGKRSSRRF